MLDQIVVLLVVFTKRTGVNRQVPLLIRSKSTVLQVRNMSWSCVQLMLGRYTFSWDVFIKHLSVSSYEVQSSYSPRKSSQQFCNITFYSILACPANSLRFKVCFSFDMFFENPQEERNSLRFKDGFLLDMFFGNPQEERISQVQLLGRDGELATPKQPGMRQTIWKAVSLSRDFMPSVS